MKDEPRVLNKQLDFIEPDAVYIGRPSKWGNPFLVEVHGREKCIELYKEYLKQNPQLVEDAKRELRGRDLICWCSPKACHGDVLLEIANS